jgi:eukaryotic-like serine/threonine-protein kinase
MALSAGVRVGPYEILSAIGAGGMGEVYRARDSRLGRDVAIKVLPAALSADPERLQRFEQEARAAAALNHPNILQVYDIGQHESAPYIVSELLEGETLRERLHAGALPVRKAIDYGIQIAHGLAAAHEKGIVHRDLKPENVFVTDDSRVKILDFGLAKLTQAEPSLAGISALPTTPPNTTPGMVLGTIGYMAPEQVRGLAGDHRSDIFAFGAVLYEMLSGRRAFHGDTTADTMSAILKEQPADLMTREAQIPPAVERVVDRCLEKAPSARFQSTHDLAFALEALSLKSGTAAALQTPAGASWSERLRWALVLVFGVITAVALVSVYRRAPAPESDAIRFAVPLPLGTEFGAGVAGPSLAVSPDGRRIALAAGPPNGLLSLYVRDVESVELRLLPGTAPANQPFWSPDGRLLAFFGEGRLKKVDVSGGSIQVMANVELPQGGTWNADDVILYGNDGGPLFQVSAAGGQPRPLTTLDQSHRETAHLHPQFLPDGRHFLYLARPSGTAYVGDLDGGEPKALGTFESKVMYASGYLLYVKQGTLMAQPFDVTRLETSGKSFSIAEQIGSNNVTGRAAFSVSEAGVLSTGSGDAGIPTRFAWFDRTGKPLDIPVPEVAAYRNFDLSPDERQIAVGLRGDIWLLDTNRGVMSRFTTDPGTEGDPIWSPDGSRLVFTSNRNGVVDLWQKPVTAAAETLLLASDQAKYPEDWSRDGRFIVYVSPQGGRGLWVMPAGDDPKPFVFLDSPFVKDEPHFSPDGNWLAYYSEESGRPEVYVQSFPGPGQRVRVSPAGGSQPRWKKTGGELFYMDLSGKLMAVSIGFGNTLEVGVPKVLFQTPMTSPTPNIDQYAATADGQRFVVLAPVDRGTPPTPITVTVNWTAALTR